MNAPVKWIVPALLALVAIGGVAPEASASVQPAPVVAATMAGPRDCVALNNLDELAAGFIERCRKGSIRREYPGTHYSRYLGEIRNGNSANDKKAWKLLNDKRFEK
ncbi:MAG TPA: hypothetical protein VGJ13_11690 [Pseudonocardiaceae bacterium]